MGKFSSNGANQKTHWGGECVGQVQGCTCGKQQSKIKTISGHNLSFSWSLKPSLWVNINTRHTVTEPKIVQSGWFNSLPLENQLGIH